MAQIRRGSYDLKRSTLEVGLPTSDDLNNVKYPSRVYPATWVLINTR